MTDDTTADGGDSLPNANDPIPTDYADRAQGMGVCLIDGNAAFRVWAPHAEAVAVTGTFDDWAAQPTGNKNDAKQVRSAKFQLVSEDNDYWYGQAAGARVGDEYRFVLMNGGQVISRIDPYARHVTNSIGNGIITDPNSYDWEGDDFTAPPTNELVIYEMHVGTFFDKDPNDDKTAELGDVESKIDHLTHLGVNAVELMPLMEFAGDYSWGYNPAHIFAIESAYDGHPASATLVLPPYSAIIVSRA